MKHLPHYVAIIAVLGGLWVLVVSPSIQMRLLEAPEDSREGQMELFQIEPGHGASTVARELEKAGLIRSAKAFRRMLKSEKWETKLKPGVYQLPRGRGARDLAEQLVEGDTWTIRVPIPEGLTLREIAGRVEKAGRQGGKLWLPTATELLKAVTPEAIESETGEPLPIENPEGYLFPATYALAAGSSAEDVVSVMAGQFVTRFSRKYAAEIERSPLKLHGLVTLASIVEKEAASDAERPLIARVFLNRVELGMKLESCATVQYALPERKTRLLFSDLRVQSPYNTYAHPGLPPGPICSPGEASLLAALRPGETDALYFVSRGDGTHVFSRTFAEHEQAIRQWRK